MISFKLTVSDTYFCKAEKKLDISLQKILVNMYSKKRYSIVSGSSLQKVPSSDCTKKNLFWKVVCIYATIDKSMLKVSTHCIAQGFK